MMSCENNSQSNVAASLSATASTARASSSSGSRTVPPSFTAHSHGTFPPSVSAASVSFATQPSMSTPVQTPNTTYKASQARPSVKMPNTTDTASQARPPAPDPSTASPVHESGNPEIVIEFSNRRWRSTAGFLQMELMSGMRLVMNLQLAHEPLRTSQQVSVKLVQLVEPNRGEKPIFRVWSNQPEHPTQMDLIWDYHVEGELPAARALRRRMRWANIQ
ncbi:hypothetical protein IE53DRAFT_212193 [Violaceomyces palustris]|uniref:Uncharacterized protein n=1 Tax=Violaceomyces palustris TaxID=1673888 RepID=A0ACD0NQR9_9BASI|nr:hypothetical protein IE53DRAFT_212193 [Violaceomyces palustris]